MYEQEKMNCLCDSAGINDYPILKEYLPSGYTYKICKFESNSSDVNDFYVKARMTINTPYEVEKWFKQFSDVCKVSWLVSKSFQAGDEPQDKRKHEYRVGYRCEYNTGALVCKPPVRNTLCPATVTVIVKRKYVKHERPSRAYDRHLTSGFRTTCIINHCHNHELPDVKTSEAMDVSFEARDKLVQLLEIGHTPDSALEAIKSDLREAFGNEFMDKAGGPRHCPDIKYCYKVYDSLKRQEKHLLGDQEDRMFEELKNVEMFYNSQQEQTCLSIDKSISGDVVIAICNPLMRRIHESWPNSKEMCYLDSSTCGNQHNYSFYTLYTHSPIGGLPLGMVLSSSNSVGSFQFGLELLKAIFPPKPFFGNASKGPVVFVSEDSAETRQALHAVFSKSILLVSRRHVLQTLWQWLWSPENGISGLDRQPLFYFLKHMMKAQTAGELQHKYEAIVEDHICKKYPHYLEYVAKLYVRRAEWSLAYQMKFINWDNDFNSLSDEYFAKDTALCLTKTSSVSQLINIIMTDFNDYFEGRILCGANNSLDLPQMPNYVPPDLPEKHVISQRTEDHYEVWGETSQEHHEVNNDLALCTCVLGKSCCPCSHRNAVARKYKINPGGYAQIASSRIRNLLGNISSGQKGVWDISIEASALLAVEDADKDTGDLTIDTA